MFGSRVAYGLLSFGITPKSLCCPAVTLSSYHSGSLLIRGMQINVGVTIRLQVGKYKDHNSVGELCFVFHCGCLLLLICQRAAAAPKGQPPPSQTNALNALYEWSLGHDLSSRVFLAIVLRTAIVCFVSCHLHASRTCTTATTP